MACVSQVPAWYSDKIFGYADAGNRKVLLNPHVPLDDLPAPHLYLPCGKCIGCLMDQRAAWSVRCYHEASLHERNCFITLTYDDAHLPPSLEQPVLSKFFRKLRDAGNKFRYFACGEYGSKTRRPHYHALIFGMDFLGGAEEITNGRYFSPVLNKAWGKGICEVGQFTLGSACYVAGYVAKKVGDPDCFRVMSRRPGIGHGWLDKYASDIVGAGSVVIEGQRFQIPPRYLKWMEESSDVGPVSRDVLGFRDLVSERKEYAERSLFLSDDERDRINSARRSNYEAKASFRGEKL